MKTLALLLVPLAAVAAPARHSLPELSVSDWSSIQSGAFDNLRHLADWSFRKVEKVFDLGDIEADIGTDVQDDSQLTIWQQLKADPNSFSKLVKLIEFEGNAQKVLDDRDLQITFFAPNNDALKPSEHHGHHDSDNDFDEVLLGELSHTPSLATLSALLDRHPSLLEEDDHHKHSHHGHGGNDDDDDDEKKKRRKEIFRKIAGYVLMYHGLEKPYTARELAQNSTFPTALKAHDGSYGGLHRRIKVERSLLPPSIKLNGYARVLVADKKAINGYFHTLQHPLFPPPSILEEAFLFPDVFSTATSAVQQVGGAKYLDLSYDRNASSRGHPVFTGVPLTTFFLPTNAAFALLPPRLKFFLFSKFGHRALAKILMYHAVPRTLLLSEFIYTEHHKHEDLVAAMRDGDDPSFHREIEVPTALENATLNVVIDKSKFLPVEGAVKITVKVNGHTAESIDVPARNGAVHVIGKVLIPPHRREDKHGADVSHLDSWENWEEWLPRWADEA